MFQRTTGNSDRTESNPNNKIFQDAANAIYQRLCDDVSDYHILVQDARNSGVAYQVAAHDINTSRLAAALGYLNNMPRYNKIEAVKQRREVLSAMIADGQDQDSEEPAQKPTKRGRPKTEKADGQDQD